MRNRDMCILVFEGSLIKLFEGLVFHYTINGGEYKINDLQY